MNRVDVEKIRQLQKETSHIRNVCILAHVDHGKTTLADNLISSNGIISPKMAGKLRYMDSREDEQLKGITMKSSAISLHFTSEGNEEYLINLIDSPGHIDFYSEVSTVVRLCDGAIILVDVVEGVCPQTQAVLRQAWIQNIKPVLVLNKIDRLILETKLSPEEAETRLTQLFEQINAVTGELFTSDVLAKSSQEGIQKKNCDEKRNQFDLNEWGTGIEDLDDSTLYFSPDQGNVVFSSATDGWGFRISTFARMYAKKLGVSSEVLNKTLWGDFYLDPKSKSVKKGAKSKGKKTLFNQLILENIWKIYDNVCNKKDELLVKKIVETLGLKVVIKNTDPKKTLQSIFSQWLPLSSSVLEMVCQLLPSPLRISEERVLTFLKGNASIDSVPAETMSLKEDLSKCSSSDYSPTVIFISKMFPFETKFLPQNQPKPLSAEERAAKREMILKKRLEGNTNGLVSSSTIVPLDPEKTENVNEKSTTFIAFARIFSGKIKKGQWLYVFGPRHDPNNLLNIDLKDEEKLKDLNVAKIQVKDLYLLMGRDLDCLDEVPAGNIFGVGGLDELVFKSASLSDNFFCPSFTDLFQEVSPIVRVAVEPKYTSDLDKLVNGLRLLNQSDPCVEVFVQETGEHVLVTSGEVHLEKCLDDLRQRFAMIDITVSSPTVPFRETVVLPPIIDRVNENIADQLSNVKLKNDHEESLSASVISDSWHLTIRAMPLSEGVIKVLGDNSQFLKICARKISSGKLTEEIDHKTLSALNNLKEKLSKLFEEEMGVDCSFVEHLWSVDPRRFCSNILINQVPGYDRPSFWDLARCCDNSLMERLRRMDRSVINGFEVASNAGPLCEEPMFGVCFIVENWIEVVKKQDSEPENECGQNEEVGGEETETEETISDLRAPLQFKGSLISCMKECCKRAFEVQPQRLMWAMYTCVIQTTAEVLGKMYGVLGKRHGRILSEEMKEGSTSFQISAVLPVIESFGFAEEFRKKTSGLAMPQLKFSHWEVIDIDPFWVPTTDEEYTHFGEKADSENVARKHMNDVRRRKGLRTTEKLVEFGEKQRTLKKNK